MAHRITPEFLAEIASEYNAHTAAGRPPNIGIAATYDVPAATARRWTWEARKIGALPPGKQGAAGSAEHPVHVGSKPLPQAHLPAKHWRVETQSGDAWIAVSAPLATRSAALVTLGIARGSEAHRMFRLVRFTTVAVIEPEA